MKYLKLFVVLALSAMTLNVAAEITAQATIKIKAVGTTWSDNVQFVQDASVAGESAPDMYADANDYCVNMWINATPTLSYLLTSDIIGQSFTFKANNHNTDYKMTFTDVIGDLKLQQGDDTNPENWISMDAPYQFTCALNEEIIFTVVKQAAPQKDYTREGLTVENWYTICVPGAIKAEDYASMMDVYTVGGYNAEKGLAVDLVSGDMGAGVPYIFQAKATQIAFNYIAESEVSNPVDGTNNLTGTFVETTTSAVAYVVANNKLNWAAAGTTVPAYRAYLNVADITELPIVNNAPGRKFLPAPKGVVTGLDGAAINGMKNGKYIMNGRFMIVKDSKIINVLGL